MMIRAAAAVCMVLGLVLAGCGARPADSPTSAGESPARSAAADAVVLDITIAHGTVNPANAALSARINEPITLNVTSDADDELHVHAVPEHEFEVKPGAAQRFEFTVDVPGRVEIELHHLNRTVAVLQVRP